MVIYRFDSSLFWSLGGQSTTQYKPAIPFANILNYFVHKSSAFRLLTTCPTLLMRSLHTQRSSEYERLILSGHLDRLEWVKSTGWQSQSVVLPSKSGIQTCLSSSNRFLCLLFSRKFFRFLTTHPTSQPPTLANFANRNLKKKTGPSLSGLLGPLN